MSNTTTPADALRTLGVAPDTYGPTINTARSPQHVDVLGRALAESVRSFEPEVLAVWNTCDEAVLAHAAAVHLGVTVSRASEVEGILTIDPPVDRDVRVAVLATEWEGRWLGSLRRLVSGNGGRLVAVAAVVASETQAAFTDVTAVNLTSAQDAKESAS